QRSDVAPAPPAPPRADDRSIAVIDFRNVTGDPNTAWLSAGIAETVTADLRRVGRFHGIGRNPVVEAGRSTRRAGYGGRGALGAAFAVVGSYQTTPDRIRITARIVDVATGDAVADAKVDGAIAGIFELQDEVVGQFSKQLGVRRASSARAAGRETASLEAYRA